MLKKSKLEVKNIKNMRSYSEILTLKFTEHKFLTKAGFLEANTKKRLLDPIEMRKPCAPSNWTHPSDSSYPEGSSPSSSIPIWSSKISRHVSLTTTKTTTMARSSASSQRKSNRTKQGRMESSRNQLCMYSVCKKGSLRLRLLEFCIFVWRLHPIPIRRPKTWRPTKTYLLRCSVRWMFVSVCRRRRRHSIPMGKQVTFDKWNRSYETQAQVQKKIKIEKKNRFACHETRSRRRLLLVSFSLVFFCLIACLLNWEALTSLDINKTLIYFLFRHFLTNN